MTAIVRRDDEQSRRDAESHERQERILEPRTICVNRRRVGDQLTGEIVSGTIPIQDGLSLFHRRWLAFARCAQSPRDRRLHRLNELSAEVAWLGWRTTR